MTTPTLALNGFEAAHADAITALLGGAETGLGTWQLTAENHAAVVLVDTDTLGGHMAWLKLTGAGRIAVACSASQRWEEGSEADLRLALPVRREALARVLARALARAGGAAPIAPPQRALPALSLVPSSDSFTDTRQPRLCDRLLQGVDKALRVPLADGALLIDPQADCWYGPGALKPLADTLLQPARAAAEIDAATLAHERSGAAQPLARLRWYAALIAAPAAPPDGAQDGSRLRLIRWPEIEREFPRHFRIAAAMMRQPASAGEIAAQVGATADEVNDFARAAQARGMLEVLPPGAAPMDAQPPIPAARR